MIVEQKTLTFDKKFTKKLKIVIVRTSYHRELVDNLEVFAKATLLAAGVQEKNIRTVIAPGSWELPILIQKVAESKKIKCDGIIALGVIVKGETYHFELIANEATSALMQISIDNHIPLAYEVLAVSDIKQAEARAGKDTQNKGIEAANAILQTIQSLRRIS